MYLSLVFLSKLNIRIDNLDVMSQLFSPLQVLYRDTHALRLRIRVHQYGGCVGFYVDCVILITC